MFRNNAKFTIFKESNQNLSDNFWDRLPDEMWDNISNYIGYQKHPVAKLFTSSIIREILIIRENNLIYSLFIDACEKNDDFKERFKYFQDKARNHVFKIKGEDGRLLNKIEIKQITVRDFDDYRRNYVSSYDGLEYYDFDEMFDSFEEILENQYENNIFIKCQFITI